MDKAEALLQAATQHAAEIKQIGGTLQKSGVINNTPAQSEAPSPSQTPRPKPETIPTRGIRP